MSRHQTLTVTQRAGVKYNLQRSGENVIYQQPSPEFRAYCNVGDACGAGFKRGASDGTQGADQPVR